MNNFIIDVSALSVSAKKAIIKACAEFTGSEQEWLLDATITRLLSHHNIGFIVVRTTGVWCFAKLLGLRVSLPIGLEYREKSY